MNRDELDGKVDQIKGKVKQATAHLTDDEKLHDEGVARRRLPVRSRKGSAGVAARSAKPWKTWETS